MRRWLSAMAICAIWIALSLAAALLTDRRLGVAGPYNLIVPALVGLLIIWAVSVLLGRRTAVTMAEVDLQPRRKPARVRRAPRQALADTVILLHTRKPDAAVPPSTNHTRAATMNAEPASEGVRR